MTLSLITEFVQLIKAEDSILWADLVDNGYDDLGEHLTLKMDDCGNIDTVSDIQLIAVQELAIVNLVVDRAYASNIPVMVDSDGSYWINAEDIDTHFA
jgi:hypothetical protein